MATVKYIVPTWADEATMRANLNANGFLLNDEDPETADVKLNNILTKDGDYFDFTYLGNIPDAWDDNLEPISYTSDVVANVAGKTDSLLSDSAIYQNRYAGQPTAYPVPIPTDGDTKAQIVDFFQEYLVPFSTSWTKVRLLEFLANFIK